MKSFVQFFQCFLLFDTTPQPRETSFVTLLIVEKFHWPLIEDLSLTLRNFC